MAVAITKNRLRAWFGKKARNSFLLSVILHGLLLLFLIHLSIVMPFHPIDKTRKPPELYIPSYVYKSAVTPVMPHPATEVKQQTKPVQKTEDKTGILPSPQKSMVTQPDHVLKQKSILDMSKNFIQQNQANTAISNMNNSEPPILMVGDRHAIVDPLAKLIGRSLSAHFRYPEIEGRFGAQGRVYIELVLHPEGYFSDVRIIEPSDIQDFNTAALYAVNTAPTVVGAGKFLPKAKRFVVGFIFE